MTSGVINPWVSADQIPEKYKVEKPYSITTYLCNGQLIPYTGKITEITSPICEQKDGKWVPTFLGTVPFMDAPILVQCLEAAVSAFKHGTGQWPTLPVAERIQYIENLTKGMVEKKDEIVRLLLWEICKNESDANKEFTRTIQYIIDTIEALKDLDRASSRFSIVEGIIAQIRRAPLGVVLCMGPFNYPLNETLCTLIPALIMGNTIVFKPPKHGTLFWRPIIEIFHKVLPAGVVNTVFGSGSSIITPIITTGKVDCLAFIGSSKAADIIRIQHPHPHRLRCVLGLDAKNPAIVCADADVNLAAKEVLLGSLSFNGQRCTALKIIFVHRNLAEAFLKKLDELIQGLKAGTPWEKVDITPLPEKNKVASMQSYIDDALSKGAKVVNKNGGVHNETVFFPAVVFPVTSEMRLFNEEQFGPIVPVAQFTDIKTPIDFIRQSKYGQQVSIFGQNSDQLARLIDPLVNQVCRVNVNAQCQRGPDVFPFTGRKDSAEMTLSVSDALRCFSIRTLVATKQTLQNTQLFTDIIHDRKSSFLSTDFIF